MDNNNDISNTINQSNESQNEIRNRKKPERDYPYNLKKDQKLNKKTKKYKKKQKNKQKNKQIKIPNASYYISGWLFGRFMGLLYIIAFLSAWVQIHGLIGEDGISPAIDYFTRLSSSSSISGSFLSHPTLFWINQSDLMIHFICFLGLLNGFGLFIDIIPCICSSICWICFLSISIAGQTFFMYQWDLLLLECGFLMMFFHSFHWNIKPFSQNPRDFHPPDAIFWLFRLLLFRIHFTRGIQELLSKDRIWRSLSVFDFNFETQPSPTYFAWYFHQLPSLFHQGLTFWVLTIEVGIIFLIFGPQLFRRTACVYILLLQIFYMLTGNFGTFFWNVCGLCLLLLDDALFPNLIRKLTRIRRKKIQEQSKKKISSSQPRLWHKRLAITLAVLLIILSTIPFSTVTKNVTTPEPLKDIYKQVYPFRIVNIYGPFYRVPHERFELLIQGSLDAQTWEEYEFLYKPDKDLYKFPCFVSPHISRLEYQLWMAAQTDYQKEVWISRLLHRILEDSPSVVNLFKKEPFTKVPEYVRAIRMKYSFTSYSSNKKEWYESEFKDIYTPSFSQTVHSMSSRRKNLRLRINQRSN